jgi:glutamate dehydrogenase (NADP+)
MSDLEQIIRDIKEKTKGEDNFHQAIDDVMDDVLPFVHENPDYKNYSVIERLLVPDRVIQFRVTWMDGEGNVHINNGWRVQYNNAIGPYKGGLRFHPSVKLDTFKFLGFEQTFKNALTGLPMGGGKGGSDFNPKGKSEADIARFCHSFMMELYKYIGPDRDVPAGDIGVGGAEIGYLFGTYKQITGQFHGALTGKSPSFGGSCLRPEATGYGAVYFLEHILKEENDNLEGKRCVVSGAGNVALHAAKKLIAKNAKVITLSDSQGTIVKVDGFTEEELEKIYDLKEVQNKHLKDLSMKGTEYRNGAEPWDVECEIALPCATQNEVDEDNAKKLHEAGVKYICEGANMPLTSDATRYLLDKDVIIAPAKAANAGGVAVSGLEQTQNAERRYWSAERVDEALQDIMKNIFNLCRDNGNDDGKINYIKGANIGGFKRVANAMQAFRTF